MSFLENVYQGILFTSLWEWIAVVTGVIYVILAALRSNLCWFFAIVSAGIYVYLCIDGKLYFESVLQFFYVVMAIVGWISWQQPNSSTLTKIDTDKINVWPVHYHALNIIISGGISLLIGLCFDKFTDHPNPYIDTFTTIFSLAATYMVIKKVLENWIYWIVIDIVSIFLYHQRGFSLSAVLYFIFTLLAIAGFIVWYRKYKTQLT